jgi:TRAP-type C4-dicarboxylate transport system substrate-binding protein
MHPQERIPPPDLSTSSTASARVPWCAVPRPVMPRRAVLAAAAGLAAPFLPRFADAAEVTWRLGHSAPTDFALHVRLQEAATAIADRSGGQMELKIYPNSQIGSPVGLLAQVRAGALDAAPLTGQLLARDLPVAALPTLGFAFAGYAELWPAMDGGIGGFLREQFHERIGLVAMQRCWDFGFRQITTSGKPVHTAPDLAGLRLRTPPEADFIELFQAFKALPIAMPLGALNRALSTHAVDGQESVLQLVAAAGLLNLQSVCALTNHVWDGQWLCVSGKSWSKLPAKLQDVVAACLNESALRQRQDTEAADVEIRRRLEAGGMTFNTVDPSDFRAVLRRSGYYAAWRARMGDDAWTVLQNHAGSLD